MPQLIAFSEQIVTYIAGYVVRAIGKNIICEECIIRLSLNFKQEWGLDYPSKDAADLQSSRIRNPANNLQSTKKIASSHH